MSDGAISGFVLSATLFILGFALIATIACIVSVVILGGESRVQEQTTRPDQSSSLRSPAYPFRHLPHFHVRSLLPPLALSCASTLPSRRGGQQAKEWRWTSRLSDALTRCQDLARRDGRASPTAAIRLLVPITGQRSGGRCAKRGQGRVSCILSERPVC